MTENGQWCSKGMNGERRQARRYHWLSEGLKDFVDEPHSAIEGPCQGEIINLTNCLAAASRSAQLDLLSNLGPDGITKEATLVGGSRRNETRFRANAVASSCDAGTP